MRFNFSRTSTFNLFVWDDFLFVVLNEKIKLNKSINKPSVMDDGGDDDDEDDCTDDEYGDDDDCTDDEYGDDVDWKG